MKILMTIDKAIERVEKCLLLLSLAIMTLMVFFNVILRSLYTQGGFQFANSILGMTDWTEPFSRLLVLWITFLGASLLTINNKHIKIDIMGSILKPPWFSVRDIIISITCVLITGIMFKSSLDYIMMERDFGQNLFLGVPSWACQLILPIGFFVICFRFFIRGLKHLLILYGNNRT